MIQQGPERLKWFMNSGENISYFQSLFVEERRSHKKNKRKAKKNNTMKM